MIYMKQYCISCKFYTTMEYDIYTVTILFVNHVISYLWVVMVMKYLNSMMLVI